MAVEYVTLQDTLGALYELAVWMSIIGVVVAASSRIWGGEGR
jgi:hypothetical protein